MPARGPVLVSVTRGMARLSALFATDVRERASSYVYGGKVEVLADEPERLSGVVRGRKAYSAVFEREGDAVFYGCSCEYFRSVDHGCKHLWALVVQAAQGAFVEHALSAARFTTRSPRVAERPASEREEGASSLEDFEEEEVAWIDPPSRSPHEAGVPRDWRQGVPVVSRESATLELVYFLGRPAPAPWSPYAGDAYSGARGSSDLEIVLGQRRLVAPGQASSARGTELRPAISVRPAALARAEDREIFAALLGSRETSAYSYGQSHVIPVKDWILTIVLGKLARTGRCHLVPSGFEREASWREFRQGIFTRKAHKGPPSDYQPFLDWPVLRRDEGAPFEIELQLVAESGPGSSGRRRADSTSQSYKVTAELVRDSERLPSARVSHVSSTGSAIVGDALVDLGSTDARWLAGLRQAPLRVPERELLEFANLAFGRAGVSRFRLPAGFSHEVSEGAPGKLLELAAPGARTTTGGVRFAYGEQRVGAETPSRLVFLGGQRVLARDVEFERAALSELQNAGFRGELLDGAAASERHAEVVRATVSVDTPALMPAIHALIASGWQVYGEGQRLRSLASFSIEIESGIDWFEVKGGGHFGEGVEVPFPELLRALRARRGVVELGDGSRGLVPEAWAARFGVFAELVPEKGEGLRISKRQLGMLELLCAAAPDASGAEALRELRARLARFRELEPRAKPAGFLGELRPYQALGLGFLQTSAELGFGACLADDMGLGKTIQVLAYLQAVHGGGKAKARARSERSLVIVPRSLLGNWGEEAKRFAPNLRLHVHWGALRGEPEHAWGDAQVILTTYGTLRLDALALSKIEFATVILDESQAIKNQDSATAKAAKLLRARQRFAMSGTPIENHVGELWSLFDFLNPGLLAELPSLKRAALGRARPSPEAVELIRRVVRPFVLRRTKREVAPDLPERIEQTLFVDLEKEERARYEELAKHYRASIGKKLKELGPERSTPHVLEALLRLRQAACHPALIDPSRDHENSAKVELLLERLRAVREEGHQALVFSQFTSLLAIIRRRLEEEGFDQEYLDGQTRDRDERVRRFQSDPSVSVFLISLKAGGVGLNLTSADYVFILDPWWNPAAEAQAIDRAHRIGQTRTVIAYRLLARATVEERVADLQNQKRELVEALLGEGALGAKLTRKDLEALLEL